MCQHSHAHFWLTCFLRFVFLSGFLLVPPIQLAHLGQPAGDFDRSAYSLRPVAARLQELLPESRVRFLTDCVGPQV